MNIELDVVKAIVVLLNTLHFKPQFLIDLEANLEAAEAANAPVAPVAEPAPVVAEAPAVETAPAA